VSDPQTSGATPTGVAARTDPSNLGQLDSWDGDGGAFWADQADRFDAGVAGYHGHFLAAASIADTDIVLDVGCGNGLTSRDAARRATAGSVLGVDLSSRMIDLARRRAADEHLTNVTFEQTDAQVTAFAPDSFDVAVSRNGSMFFGDPVAAFTNIARAVRPGGRMVLLTWQPFVRNEWLSALFTVLSAGRDLPPPPSDAPSPLALSDPDRVRSLLGAAGFSDVGLRDVREPMYFGADPDDAFGFVSAHHAGLVRDLDPDTRACALDDLRADLVAHHTEQGVLYGSAAWLIEARRS
jgi:SAM-dependent methyltransferase